MAKITKQAQEILCQMIDEKAAVKRSELEKTADKANEKKREAFKGDVVLARAEIATAYEEYVNKAESILEKRHLKFSQPYYGIIDLCRSNRYIRKAEDICDYFESTDKSKMLDGGGKTELALFNEKVEKAKREVVLRATLLGDYNEIMKLINNINF